MRPTLVTAVLCVVLTACASPSTGPELTPSDPPPGSSPALDTAPSPSQPEASPSTVPATPSTSASAPPPWLGARVLPEGEAGFGAVLDTPPELRDRRLRTTDLLPPPKGKDFVASVRDVPEEVLDRSTWSPDCPVGADDLAYVTLSFWGFDDRAHTGELLLHRTAASDVVEVFEAAFEARFPIEEMRIVAPSELELPPTGDGNNTTAFVCRAVRGSQNWSQHARGLAVDVNPFHNPYVKGNLVLPELASAYSDRDDVRPGMLRAGGPVVTAFAGIGWEWGGTWDRPIDWMHFSRDGG